MLKIGSRGQTVKELQEKLLAKGYDPGVIDGIFGAGTDKAVRNYQRDNNLVADGIVGPTTLSNLDNVKVMPGKSKYYMIGNAHVIETSPDNIEISILGNTLRGKGVYGINGTFFDTPRAYLPGSCWGIATNDGKPIGGNAMLVSYDKRIKRGTLVCYQNDDLEVIRVNSINEFRKPHKWAISGYSVYPFMDFREEKMPGGIDYKTAHTYIGHKGNTVYLIVKPYHMIRDILPIVKELQLEGCIVLDGGGSSQLRHKNGSYNANRKINSAVLLKEV